MGWNYVSISAKCQMHKAVINMIFGMDASLYGKCAMLKTICVRQSL